MRRRARWCWRRSIPASRRTTSREAWAGRSTAGRGSAPSRPRARRSCGCCGMFSTPRDCFSSHEGTSMRRALGLVAIWSAAATPAFAQREPVLKQVGVPHAYYWREMYVPQVTSGPSAVTWSPDGTELIYAMQGSLWRQRIGSRVAQQLTAGAGYDYQPDWSPDGRLVVFARYAHDAIELQLLDLASGSVQPVTANGAVNVEPRWSPDGTRIAFVSSAYNRRWHIFTVAMEAGAPAEGTVTRLTEDNDSRLPRYYYSVWDHYLSPTWSPDGRELIIVANRGHIHGTGGFWRMTATPGAPMRELRYEETTWKARPDWSPDGTRVVYSSYLGRQWHQLWLMTSEGGDVFPLTYGEFDATAPRWSRDAKHIAYISNEGGNTALWVIDLPGAQRRQIVAAERRYREAVGRLRIVVVDAAGRPLAARLAVASADGRAYAPDDAWRHADEAFDRAERAFEYGYFHAAGTAELTVPAGALRVAAWHGPEYRVARAAGEPAGSRLVEWRPARAHELRGRVSQHAESSCVSGTGRGPARGRESDREQRAANPGHRILPRRSRSGIEPWVPATARSGVSHQLLGAHGLAGPFRPLRAARVRRLSQHGGRESLPDERRRGGPGARAGRAVRIRAPVRQQAGPDRHDGTAHLRAPAGRGAR